MVKRVEHLKSAADVAAALNISVDRLIGWLDDNGWVVIGDSISAMPERIVAKDLVNSRQGTMFTEQGFSKIRDQLNPPSVAEEHDRDVEWLGEAMDEYCGDVVPF